MSPTGLDHDCVVSLDNVLTIPKNLLGRTIGVLSADQELLWPEPSSPPMTGT